MYDTEIEHRENFFLNNEFAFLNIEGKQINFLDFERSIANIYTRILELKAERNIDSNRYNREVQQLELALYNTICAIYSNLSADQHVKIARHIDRPRTLDYIAGIFDDFVELHGDRHFADDMSIIGGLAKIDQKSFVVVGQQKGRNTTQNLKYNFGMPRPEGYRKALRIMKLAEKFSLPIITFIDTPGAYPGIGAEERNQSEAIASSIAYMLDAKTPIICNIIGEGGSGGALALGVGDKVHIMQYAIYSVISPEGCASILWRDPSKSSIAANALKLTAEELEQLCVVDSIVKEPLGGAHRNYTLAISNLKEQILTSLNDLEQYSIDQLIQKRIDKINSYGIFSTN